MDCVAMRVFQFRHVRNWSIRDVTSLEYTPKGAYSCCYILMCIFHLVMGEVGSLCIEY